MRRFSCMVLMGVLIAHSVQAMNQWAGGATPFLEATALQVAENIERLPIDLRTVIAHWNATAYGGQLFNGRERYVFVDRDLAYTEREPQVRDPWGCDESLKARVIQGLELSNRRLASESFSIVGPNKKNYLSVCCVAMCLSNATRCRIDAGVVGKVQCVHPQRSLYASSNNVAKKIYVHLLDESGALPSIVQQSAASYRLPEGIMKRARFGFGNKLFWLESEGAPPRVHLIEYDYVKRAVTTECELYGSVSSDAAQNAEDLMTENSVLAAHIFYVSA